jgi:hypothetical protein
MRARITVLFILAVLGVLSARPAAAQSLPQEWLTPTEAAGFEATPSYDETLAFLRKIQARLPEMELGFFGSSAQGRPLPFVVLSKERVFTADKAQQLPKPILLIQSGIHAGEIDGKDATLMILRDMALGRHREILDALTLVFVPIYNVDGHERVSPYNRPNQDGPRRGMGFRTTADGHDLNRDFLKVSTVEARALISLISAWRPHLHVDNHVTDGVDHDWVLTWTWAEAPQAPAPVDSWLHAHMPAVLAATEKAGHRNGPYVDLEDRDDPAKGFSSWVGEPRYSSGYFPLRNRPSILIEMHSYKPYRQRVLANRDFLLALFAEVARDPGSLTKAVQDAEAATVALGKPDAPPSEVVVEFAASPEKDRIRFPVYASEKRTSLITGGPLLHYERGTVQEIEVPWQHKAQIVKSVPRPRGYFVLPGWPEIEQRLRWHGLHVQRLTEPAAIEVEAMRVADPKYAERPYQGLTQVTARAERRPERRNLPAGTLWVPADQPDFEVAVQLLEPDAPDSLLAWGLLSTVFEQKEYIDGRVLEGLAQEMVKDPQVAAAWQEALKDPAFAGNASARYLWWYRRTPYWDETVGLLPVFRALKAPAGLKTQAWP